MQVDTKKLPQSRVELTITVEPKEMETFLEQAAAKLSHEVKVDGFRPGKAPRSVMTKKVGEHALWEEAVKVALPSVLEQALKEQKIEALGRSRVSVVKLAPKNPFIFKVEVAIMPSVVLGDYKRIKVKAPSVKKINKQDVDNLILELRKMRAKLITVKRGASKGDRVEIDFWAYSKNNLIEGGETKDHPFILGEGRFVAGFEDKIVGMQAGGEKEFEIKFPRDYFKENLAGKLIRFKVKMNLVQEVELPEANDKFSQSLGSRFKSLDALKAELKDNLVAEAKKAAEEKYELAVLERVCASSQTDIPQTLISYEQDRMLHELEHDVLAQGANFEDYLKSLNKTREELKQGWVEQATKRIKTSLVLMEIAKAEKVKVADKEIEAELNNILKNSPNLPEIRERVRSKEYKDHLRGMIQNRKVVRMLCKDKS